MEVTILLDDCLGELLVLKQYILHNNLRIAKKDNSFSNLDSYKNFANKISKCKDNKGVIFTTYGVDAFLVANKVKNSIAAFITDEVSAKLCIEHNNANIIIFPLYIISENYSIQLLNITLNSFFKGFQHTKRVDMLYKL